MAYLGDKGYVNDLFVSYAHVDDAQLQNAPAGWVTTFIMNLKIFIKQNLEGGNDLNVWMDHQLAGTLNEGLMKELQGAGTFLVIMSKRYLDSEWCRKEREAFLKLVKQRKTEEGSRIFVLEIDEFDKNKYPIEFDNLVRYPFWIRNFEDKAARPLGFPVPIPSNPDDKPYYKKLLDLSEDIAKELKRIKDVNEVTSIPEKTVFLAEVTDDMEDRREEVKRYLVQSGYKVIPETWQDYQSLNSFKEMHKDGLSKCAVFVQLLSNVTGKRPFNQFKGYPLLRYESAVDSKIKILQWRNPKLDLEKDIDPDQLHLLKGANVRAEGIEDFKRAIVEALKISSVSPGEGETPSKKFVYISADAKDWQHVKDNICSYMKLKGIEYYMCSESKDPVEYRKIQETGLLNCDVALITYCLTDPSSVLSKVMQFRKIINQRETPIDLVVYDGPPCDKPEVDLNLTHFRYLNCRKDLDDFNKFLTTLENAS